MATVYEVDVAVRLKDQVAGALNSMRGQLGALSAAGDQTTRTIGRLGGAFTALFAMREVERFGMAGVRAFGAVIEQGETLEMALTRLQLVTGANVKQMREYHRLAETIQLTHILTTPQATDLIGFLRKSGVKQADLPAALEASAQFADVMKTTQHMDVEQSAQLAMQFFTMRSAHGTAERATALNALYKASQVIPESEGGIQSLFNVFRKLAAVGDLVGLSLQQQLELSAVMVRSGQGRGGEQLRRLVTEIAEGGTSKKSQEAVKALGITLANFEEFRGATLPQLAKAFGQVGGSAAALLLSPGGQESIQAVRDAERTLPDLGDASKSVMQTFTASLGVAGTTFQSILGDTGAALGKDLIGPLELVNTALAAFQGFLTRHPGAAPTALAGFGGASVGAMVGSAGGLGLAGLAALFGGPIGWGTAAVMALLGGLQGAAVGGGGAALAEMWHHDHVGATTGEPHTVAGAAAASDTGMPPPLSAPLQAPGSRHPASAHLRRAADALDRGHIPDLGLSGRASAGASAMPGAVVNPTTGVGNPSR